MTGPATRCKLLAIRRYTPLSETTSSIQTIRIPGWWGQGQGDRRIQPEIWTYTFQLYMDCKKRWIQDPIFNHPVLISPIYVFARHYCQDSKPIDRQLAFCTPTTENISVYIHPSWYRIYIYIFSNPLPPTPPSTLHCHGHQLGGDESPSSREFGGRWILWGKLPWDKFWREKWGKNSSCGCGCCLGRWYYNFPAVWGL